MNNNFYDIPVDWYKDLNNGLNMIEGQNMHKELNINNQNSNLTSPKEGLIKGNMFKNLFDPYKNYKLNELKPTNNQEELLYNLLKYKFALTELDLYLDTHPEDTEIINLYNMYLSEEKRICNEYEKNYNALSLDSEYLKNNPWEWLKSPWPWEGTR